MQNNIDDFLKNHLTTRFVGKQIYFYDVVTSTMKIAKKLAREGVAEGATVIANKQTAGRGRLERTWLSPDENIAMSIVLHPPLKSLPKLIMIASVAVLRAIREVAGIKPQIKWPNDIMINGRKVCGILIENEVKGDRVSFSVVGIGINVNLDPSDIPEISNIATSLSVELGKEVPLAELVCAVLTETEKLYIQAQSSTSVYQEWQEYMETLGKLVRVQFGASIKQGKAEAVNEAGNLILRHSDGHISEILAGDVTTLKD